MSLRDEIARLFRTDADFDAFCLDNFPEVHRRFSLGMDRVQKVNLLLQIEEQDKVQHLLSSYSRSPCGKSLSLRLIILVVCMCAIAILLAIALDSRDLHRAKTEYRALLEVRAQKTESKLRAEDPQKADEFIKLHKENLKALEQNHFTLSHEITRAIQKILDANTEYQLTPE